MECSDCFTCGEKPAKFYEISNAAHESTIDIRSVICQHFWFQEEDLQNAVVCEACWVRVDEFHRFYQQVRKLHEQEFQHPPIKVEKIEIEEHILQETAEVKDEKPCEGVESKLETAEECNRTSSALGNSNSELRKPRRTSKKPTAKKVPKLRPAYARIIVPLEQQKVEDDFIKQHRPYVCSECFEEFDDFCTIRRHAYAVHRKKYITCCDTQYRSRSMLYQHVQNLLNPEAIRCEICSKTFKFQSGYIRHKEEIHPDEHELIFKCQRCPRSFPKQKLLRRHVAEHETLDNEKAKCDICGKCFRTQLLMRRHIVYVHEKSYDFICELCSRRFARSTELTAHRKVHELTAEQLRKQCPVCNKWLKNIKEWSKHVQRHGQEGEYKCEQCSHVSVNLMALKRHIERQHRSDARKYPCELCGKEYSRPVTLREHIANTHTGEPLYQCPYCERKFFSNATMYSHKKKEHPQKWLEDHKTKYAATADKPDGVDGSTN